MKQQSLAMANGFERYTKKTRRTLFLEEMEQVVPWAELCALQDPHSSMGVLFLYVTPVVAQHTFHQIDALSHHEP